MEWRVKVLPFADEADEAALQKLEAKLAKGGPTAELVRAVEARQGVVEGTMGAPPERRGRAGR